jgi:ubiquinone/menaquinone biosynthesis C-methylase UbiE
MHFAFAPSLVLASAVQLNVFTHIAEGRQTAGEISRAERATERGTRMLLDALVAIDLLRKPNGRYELTPAASAYLVRSSPDYVGALVEEGDEMLRPWLQLTEVIRTGKAPHRVGDQKTAEEFFPKLVRSLHVVNREPARRTARYLGAGNGAAGLRVVDIGCGSGVWGIAIAEADPQARITAQDYPGMLEETKRYIERHGVGAQYEFLPGDLKTVDFGVNRFDVALLGNIVHSEGERSSRDLFGRLARALKPGGRIVIIDMVPNDQRTGPAFPVIFALNMLVHTGEGDTFTLAEYRRWLHHAGFPQVETADIGTHSPLIVGRKG